MTETVQLSPPRVAGPSAPSLPVQVLLGGVWLYQQTLSPVLPALFGPAQCGCRFNPTCSRYAAEALRVHGALAGSGLALCRLLKCTPLHPGGNDPVPARGEGTPPTPESIEAR